jgi:hypothetical protein
MTAGTLAFAFKSPVLALDKDKEADALAEAISKVMRHYGDIPGLNEKTLDWLGLLYTGAIIVGPRVAVIAATKKKAAPDASDPSSARPAAPAAPNTVKIPGVGEVELAQPPQGLQ